MAKYIAMCIMILGGCVVDTTTEDDYSDPVLVEDAPEEPDYPGHSVPHDLGCPGEAYEMLDGSLLIIPGLCAPFYIYKGYPDPTEESNPYDEKQHQFNNQTKEQ